MIECFTVVQLLDGCLYIAGITGILCSRFCREVVLTDHNEEVLRVRLWYTVSLLGEFDRLIKVFINFEYLHNLSQILKKNVELHSSSQNHNGSSGERNTQRKASYKCEINLIFFWSLICRISRWKTRMGKFWAHLPHFRKIFKRIWSYSWSWHLYPDHFFFLKSFSSSAKNYGVANFQ